MPRPLVLCFAAAALVGLTACEDDGRIVFGTDTSATIDAQLRAAMSPYAVPIAAPPPQNPAQAELGRMLLFDPLLSGNKDVACATCHHPSLAFADALPLAIGTGGSGLGATRQLGSGRQFVPRSAPSLLNQGLGFNTLFWDGRLVGGPGSGFFVQGEQLPLPSVSNILAAQAFLPVLNRHEMRGLPGDTDRFGQANELAAIADDQPQVVWSAVMARLMAVPQYVQLFAAAFPQVPAGQHQYTHAAQAIAAFEIATLTRTNSPFDRFLARQNDALTEQEKRGGLLFFGRAQCSSCHLGPLLGGQQLANVGVPQLGPGVGRELPLDLGRGAIDTQTTFYEFAFRVPPLRNVELTAPYFHDGAYPTLEAVVRHYNDVAASIATFDGSHLPAAVRAMHHGDAATISRQMQNLDFRLRQPLNLTPAEQADLVAFLKALTDPAARNLAALRPAQVPSGLPVP
jgi:cytochrome c peroxidase